ncbi:ski oncogene [Thrips palmi]|uniref:Ski oncogene n=1 Tax=Thrips palmi TaxID=161013 RepID=A0A6P8YXV3_THRPL|nr:ski oncogene [Thrips palmi]
METLGGKRQGCNPHLKKVLKSYQLSAQRSLHGPSTLASLGSLPSSLPSPTVLVSPPAQPAPAADTKVTLPLLSAADRGDGGRAERLDTDLEGQAIACFVVGGEKRLCLPQVLNLVLRDFSLGQINSVCDELHIYCSRSNPEQLEELQATGDLPMTAASCGLITQTDAERLCAALLPRGVPCASKTLADGFHVYHECFGRAQGLCRPDEPLQRSIECLECRLLFGPQQFVSHAHRHPETSTVHWGFDSANWRAYLLLAEDQDSQEELRKRLAVYKERARERLKRKQVDRDRETPPVDVQHAEKYDSLLGAGCGGASQDASQDALHYLKKARLDDAVLPPHAVTAATAGTTYIPAYPADPAYLYWYDTWALSAFRPWHSLFTASKDGKATPMPFLRDSLPPVPPYLGQGPPVLLHPDRVVPMEEYDRFERSYQPNVALLSVPSQEPAEEKYSHVDVTSTEDEEAPQANDRPKSPSHAVSTITLNPSRRSPSPARSPSLPPPPPPKTPSSASVPSTPTVLAPPVTSVVTRARSPALKCKAEVEMSSDTEDSASESTGVDTSVAAVLESLSSDEKDARMAKVLRSLVKRLGEVEAERGRLTAENEVLRRKTQDQDAVISQQERVIQRLQEQHERLNSKHDPDAFQDKVMAMEKELRTLRSEVSRLPNGRHESVSKTEAVTNGSDTEERSPIKRESVEATNIAVSVIHKSETQALSGTE